MNRDLSGPALLYSLLAATCAVSAFFGSPYPWVTWIFGPAFSILSALFLNGAVHVEVVSRRRRNAAMVAAKDVAP